MTEWLLALVPQYGGWLIAITVFLGCLALPVPASILLIAAGGFIAAGDLALASTALVALGSAAAGDQVVYFAGRWRGRGVIAWLGARAAPITRASALLERRGGFAVFLSRWLIPALGPYVNLAAGGSGLGWLQFTLWGLAGEAVWVALYIGLGYAFMGNLAAASDMALNVVAVLGAMAVSVALGTWLVRRHAAARRLTAARRPGAPAA
ncbi:MAG: DedA family protein [Bauldia sp.]